MMDRCSFVANFYPRPPRGGRQFIAQPGNREKLDFYPRPPRGGRPIIYQRHQRYILFLSTPSARRATPPGQVQQIRHVDFYPRPPRGGRLANAGTDTGDRLFLSTPSARRATAKTRSVRRGLRFLSTPSARRATRQHGRRSSGAEISIHALREEGDVVRHDAR